MRIIWIQCQIRKYRYWFKYVCATRNPKGSWVRILFNKIALKGIMVLNKPTSKHVPQNKKKKRKKRVYQCLFWDSQGISAKLLIIYCWIKCKLGRKSTVIWSFSCCKMEKNSDYICLYAYNISVYVELFIDLHLSIHMRVHVRIRKIFLLFAFCSIICRNT